MPFSERLRNLIEDQTKGNISEFARRCGLDPSSIRQYLGGTEPSLSKIAGIATATGISVDWLVFGDDFPPSRNLVPPIEALEEDSRPRHSIPIRIAEVRASAGNGSYVADDEDTPRYMDIPRAILDGIGLKPHHARVMEAVGSSMQPTIDDGDLMLVDISLEKRERINDGRVYVFSVADIVYVKRLRYSPSGVVMRADNIEQFPAEEQLPPEQPLTIFGRVLWTGRKL